MKKILYFLLIASVLLSASVCAVTAEETEEITEFGVLYYGTIEEGGEPDWYTLTTDSEEAYYIFTLNNESGTSNIHLLVYDERETQLYDLGYYTGQGESITGGLKLEAETTYYVQVYLNDDGTGNYSFEVKKNIDAAADGRETAGTVTLDEMQYQSVDGAGDPDWFVLETGDESAFYEFYVKNESGTGNIHLDVYNERDAKMLEVGYYTGAGEEASGSLKTEPNAKYYFVIYMNDDGVGNYAFSVSKHSDAVGNEKEDATAFSLNEAVGSTIDGAGDIDFFVLTTGDSTREYQVIYNNLSGTANGHLDVYSARDELLLELGYYTGAGESDSDTITLQANTTYYFRAYMNDNGVGAYSFRVSQCIEGHTSTDHWTTEKEPGCLTAGESVKKCSVCGEILETEEIEALGHHVEEWEIIEEATPISFGRKMGVCTRCGDTAYANDYSKIWVIPVGVLAAIGILIGLVNYVKASRRRR